eukprot:m.235583 g.235583  ORF g.235583 m.235583 type:complete len:302 (+) comp19343_c0_seq1:626-1531(+)
MWDALTLARILQYYMATVFSRILVPPSGGEHDAKSIVVFVAGVAQQRNNRSHSIAYDDVPISDNLHVMHQIHSIVSKCCSAGAGAKADDAKKELYSIVLEAQQLLAKVQVRGPSIVSINMSATDYNTQLFYENSITLEAFLRASVGPIAFESTKVSLVDNHANPVVKRALARASVPLKCVTKCRHWYFHRNTSNPDVVAVYEAMVETVKVVTAHTEGLGGGCRLVPPVDTTGTLVAVDVGIPNITCRMTIPVPRTPNLVGRRAEVASLVTWLSADEPRTCVLVHGPPGVGKRRRCSRGALR